jgi:hypothetical protein
MGLRNWDAEAPPPPAPAPTPAPAPAPIPAPAPTEPQPEKASWWREPNPWVLGFVVTVLGGLAVLAVWAVISA